MVAHMMTPDEELEHRVNSRIAGDEEYPFCRRCDSFVYLDYAARCMRCRGTEILWRRLPMYGPDPQRRILKGLLAVAAVLLAGTFLFLLSR